MPPHIDLEKNFPPGGEARLSLESLRHASELLKALGHLERLRIVELLEERGELPVCSIYRELSQPQPTTSLHLNKMRVLGLVACRRTRGQVFYRLAPSPVRGILRSLRVDEGPVSPQPLA